MSLVFRMHRQNVESNIIRWRSAGVILLAVVLFAAAGCSSGDGGTAAGAATPTAEPATPTPIHTATATITSTAVPTASATATRTASATPTKTDTPSVTPTATSTATVSPTPTARVPNPVVSLASGGLGRASGGLRYDVTEYGYTEREYFFAGTAKTYPPSTLPPAGYRSRMIVWAPADPARFNGVTVVEWAHVSDFGQFELAVTLNFQSPMLMARGYAFVLVSAEEGGVCDRSATGCTPTSLQGADPERYAALDHPGDAYAFDIFNQALQAIRHPTGTAPLGELRTEMLIAEGFQASVDKWFPVGIPDPERWTSPFSVYGALNAYLASGADADAQLADAFLIDGAAPAIEPVYRVPTLHHLDESAIRRVPSTDGPLHVTWEVIGAAHTDRWAGNHINIPSSAPAAKFTREEEEARRDRFDDFVPDEAAAQCVPGPRTGSVFPRRFTLNAALVALHDWVATGVPAPSAPRAERVGPVPESATMKLARDADGNALGGLRSPIIAVPVATYNGEACVQAGTTVPLPPARLAELYGSHEDYVRQLRAATDAAVAARFLLCEDAGTILRKASASSIGGADAFSAAPACADPESADYADDPDSWR